MITMIGFLGLWKSVLAFIAHLQDICTVVGVIAIAIPVLDQYVRKMEARHPNSKFWSRFDKMLFGCGNALVNIGAALDKMLAKRKEIQGS